MSYSAQNGMARRLALGLLLLASACSSGGATQHTSSDAAISDGATPDGTTDASVRLVARMQGDELFVDVERGSIYQLSCSAAIVAQKYVAGQWVPLQDDVDWQVRSQGYYLDDRYVDAELGLGCDVVGCDATSKTIPVTAMNERVRIGSRAAPVGALVGGGLAPGASVAVIQTRPFHGKLRAHLSYSKSSSCATTQTVDLEVDVPEQGVCCAIGSTQCSSEGPGGGWAPSQDACTPWIMEYDAAFTSQLDVRGCPKLVQKLDACCGCAPGLDAGL